MVMRDVKFFSAALGREMSYRVFLPASAAPGEKFSVVYLLHGNGGDFLDWSNQSNAAEYAAKGMVLVMPEGGSSYFLNAAERPRDRYEDYLVHDLVADVEARFPVERDREHRAVVGVSMGGFAAIKMGLSHPEEFVFVGAMSPPVDVPERRFTLRRAGQWLGFREIFGPMGSEARRARNPFVLVQSANPGATPFIYLTAGEEEALFEPDRSFAARLKQRGFDFEFYSRPGGHDWNDWNGQILGCFHKLFETLPKAGISRDGGKSRP